MKCAIRLRTPVVAGNKNVESFVRRGFTMIELMVVIGIIGILMAVLLGTFRGSSDSARTAQCQTNMRNLAVAVQTASLPKSGAIYAYYPYAGSFRKYQGTGSSRKEVHEPGWISWTKSGNYQPSDADDQLYCLTNGAHGLIWKALKGSRKCYRCPSDEKYYPNATWSYVMNADFYWDSKGSPRAQDHTGRSYPLQRADRILLFGEIERGVSSESEDAIDPVLQYKDCDGCEDAESIGFGTVAQPKHLDGRKKRVSNVCFADGHVEKFYYPNEGEGGMDLEDVTKYLCHPTDESGQHVDISFDGKNYKKVTD